MVCFVMTLSDYTGLYYLAYAITFNEESEMLWPYRATTIESILGVYHDNPKPSFARAQLGRLKQAKGSSKRQYLEPIFDAFFVNYYLKAILGIVSKHKFLYLAIYESLCQLIKVAVDL